MQDGRVGPTLDGDLLPSGPFPPPPPFTSASHSTLWCLPEVLSVTRSGFPAEDDELVEACPDNLIAAAFAENRQSGSSLADRHHIFPTRPSLAIEGSHGHGGETGRTRTTGLHSGPCTLELWKTLRYPVWPDEEGWPSGLRRTPGERVYLSRVSWVRIPPPPPFIYCEPRTAPHQRRNFFWFQRGLAVPTEPRRPARFRFLVSERFSSLSDRTSPDLVRSERAWRKRGIFSRLRISPNCTFCG